ncbi:MAG: cell division ATP-binding protein FtsE [Candidatus Levybacteria bacterium CG_4_10_14_0_8_um_filter_35_23]|nr:MAG: cell division ATP-binding protein FtsE [Candidatus Levybacteria bacterium CG_4_10_14_0_8_um_filter_35_23]
MIKLNRVSKKFGTGVFGLSNVSFNMDKGEFVFLVGPSGSGKTTIFKLLTREILPTEGTIIINDWDIVRLSKAKIPHLRKKVGVIFQDLKILMDRTIFENVMLPLEVAGIEPEESKKRVNDVLAQVGLSGHKEKFPIQLAGGELQRAAIARALVLSPDIILADEATGNLDTANSWDIIKILTDINEKGTTIIMATHNLDIVKNLPKRIIEMNKGNIVKDSKISKEKKDSLHHSHNSKSHDIHDQKSSTMEGEQK